jgi:hypothetical protein
MAYLTHHNNCPYETLPQAVVEQAFNNGIRDSALIPRRVILNNEELRLSDAEIQGALDALVAEHVIMKTDDRMYKIIASSSV